LGDGTGTGIDCAVAMDVTAKTVTPLSTIAPKVRISVSDFCHG
jgi:hypothetical protein